MRANFVLKLLLKKTSKVNQKSLDASAIFILLINLSEQNLVRDHDSPFPVD